ncbi:MAG TPA: NlpC/P60 family protein [Mycobacteriales bacterium]|nr:NlpC/P60 family protein [Mycobacteriales bacterium]
MKHPRRRSALAIIGVGGGLITAGVACIAMLIMVSLFGAQSGIQSLGAGCSGYQNSIASQDGAGAGQGIYNPVMPAGGMYLPSQAALNEIPPRLMLDTWNATARYPGYDWTMLAGQMYQETKFGQDPSAAPGGSNYAGYKGILQFGDPAWAQYGADGNGDGKKDLYNPTDAAYGAANYLHADNIETDAAAALTQYSGFSTPDNEYVRVVLTQAARYRGKFTTDKALIKRWQKHLADTVKKNPDFPVMGKDNGIPSPVDISNADISNATQITAAPASAWSAKPLGGGTGPATTTEVGNNQAVSSDQCAQDLGGPASYSAGPGGPLPKTPSAIQAAVLTWARSQLGKPYVWGAPRLQGTDPTSFDCSSLVQWAWYQATGGQVLLGYSTHDQLPKLRQYEVQPGKEQPGDLIFFGFGAALHHVAMVYDPSQGSAIQAPQEGEPVGYTKYNNAQHPNIWSDQVGIFRPPIPAGTKAVFPAGLGPTGNNGGAQPAAYQILGTGPERVQRGRPAAGSPRRAA